MFGFAYGHIYICGTCTTFFKVQTIGRTLNDFYSAQKKKLSAPEEGQNFSPMIKSQNFFVSVYSYLSC